MKIFKGLLKKISWRCAQRGITLLESAVAISLLGGGVVVMVLAMSGGVLAVSENGQEVAAQELARTQMEYIKSYTYNPGATTYPTVNVPEGYSISIGVNTVPNTNTDIQKVTANISRNGAVIMAVTDYKVNR
ncbi:MAG: type II secretion system protein [Dehalococcoidales bacterium]